MGILPSVETERLELVSDASGSWGCATVWGTQWLQWRWNAKAQSWHIAPKEFLPVLLACIVWGKEWSGKLIRCHCDNMAVVEVLNSGYSRDREMMHLLRCLFFIAEHFHMQVEAVHLPGKENGLANALSRDNIPRFLQACPGAAKSPTHLPRQALALLVEEQPDWTSPCWTELFVSSIGKDLHNLHSGHMHQGRGATSTFARD